MVSWLYSVKHHAADRISPSGSPREGINLEYHALSVYRDTLIRDRDYNEIT